MACTLSEVAERQDAFALQPIKPDPSSQGCQPLLPPKYPSCLALLSPLTLLPHTPTALPCSSPYPCW